MSEERPWENTAEVPQRFQEVAAGNENAGPYQPSKVHNHAAGSRDSRPHNAALNADSPQENREKRPATQTFSEPSSALTPSETQVTKEDVFEALKDVIDPELGINIVDLGLVYGVEIQADGIVTLEMTLTSAACPLTDMLEEQTRWVLSSMATSVAINWVWMPPWGPDRITEEGREQLRALGFNV
nr:metal-sulfur cluster assembly factor [Varibaculum vaginae]